MARGNGEAGIDGVDDLGRYHHHRPDLVTAALYFLGHTYQRLGDDEQCLIAYRACFEYSLAIQRPESDILPVFNRLQSMLIRAKDWMQLARLRDEHAALHEKLPDRVRLFAIPPEVLILEDGSGLDQHHEDDSMDWQADSCEGQQSFDR
jgi:hypothetical protein